MARTNVKRVRDEVIKMLNAWLQGAPTVKFKGISATDFQAQLEDAQNDDREIEEMEAQVKMRKLARNAKYAALNIKRNDVREGVEGDPNFGDDSPLYGAMGFIIKSLRKSGLIRGKNKPNE